MSTTKREEALNTLDAAGQLKWSIQRVHFYRDLYLKKLNTSSNVSQENKKRKLSMPPYDSNDPKVGDIIGCSDGDVGVVISTHLRYSDISDDSLMVEVSWSSGRILTDPWSSKDFSSAKNMFWIMSRA